LSAYLYLAVVVIGFAGGYYLRDLQADAELAAQLQVQNKKERQYLDSVAALEKRGFEQSEKQRVVYRDVVKKVPEIITKYRDSDCAVGADVAGMFNRVQRSFAPGGGTAAAGCPGQATSCRRDEPG